MKKRMKVLRRRGLALFLALTMSMSMSLTAFAEGSDDAGDPAPEENISIEVIFTNSDSTPPRIR